MFIKGCCFCSVLDLERKSDMLQVLSRDVTVFESFPSMLGMESARNKRSGSEFLFKALNFYLRL